MSPSETYDGYRHKGTRIFIVKRSGSVDGYEGGGVVKRRTRVCLSCAEFVHDEQKAVLVERDADWTEQETEASAEMR